MAIGLCRRPGHHLRARLVSGTPVCVLGHQKGRNTKENLRHNFGMPRPEGYRKALRVMKLARVFGDPSSPSSTRRVRIPDRARRSAVRPRRSQRTFETMAQLPVPIIATVIGEAARAAPSRSESPTVFSCWKYSVYS